MDTKKNIHAGHRRRLMELAYKAGHENLSDIQAVELVLCYVFPRGDVNPLAHRLLDRYKNLPSILEAPVEDLKMVEGMGYMSSLKMHNLLSIFNTYTIEKASKQERMTTTGEVYDYIESLLRFKKEEECHMIGINAQGEVIAERCVGRGKNDRVEIDMKEVTMFLITYNLPAAIIVHNHPDGKCVKSTQDAYTNDKLKYVLDSFGCRLVDDLVIGIDGIYSIERRQMRRLFVDQNSIMGQIINQRLDAEQELRSV